MGAAAERLYQSETRVRWREWHSEPTTAVKAHFHEEIKYSVVRKDSRKSATVAKAL